MAADITPERGIYLGTPEFIGFHDFSRADPGHHLIKTTYGILEPPPPLIRSAQNHTHTGLDKDYFIFSILSDPSQPHPRIADWTDIFARNRVLPVGRHLGMNIGLSTFLEVVGGMRQA